MMMMMIRKISGIVNDECVAGRLGLIAAHLSWSHSIIVVLFGLRRCAFGR